ncbi:MAG: hypothetical protein HPY71_14590 [Firmicutes bacterium]|nr:hypothetical protein [Bacillota bacterium]
MADFIDELEALLKKDGEASLRSLEARVRARFGEEAKVSKSLINYYLQRKTLPTYPAIYQLAVALDLDAKKLLAKLHEYRKKCRVEEEAEAYRKFIRSIGI